MEILLRVPKGALVLVVHARDSRHRRTHPRSGGRARDIDDSVRTRRALRASETMFRTSMMRNPNGMVMRTR